MQPLGGRGMLYFIGGKEIMQEMVWALSSRLRPYAQQSEKRIGEVFVVSFKSLFTLGTCDI